MEEDFFEQEQLLLLDVRVSQRYKYKYRYILCKLELIVNHQHTLTYI